MHYNYQIGLIEWHYRQCESARLFLKARMLVAFFHTRLIAGAVVAGHLDMVIESVERKLTKYILPLTKYQDFAWAWNKRMYFLPWRSSHSCWGSPCWADSIKGKSDSDDCDSHWQIIENKTNQQHVQQKINTLQQTILRVILSESCKLGPFFSLLPTPEIFAHFSCCLTCTQRLGPDRLQR